MVVHDAEYCDSAGAYCAFGAEFEASLERYLKILREVSELSSGEFSDGMNNFCNTAEMLLTAAVREMMATLSRYMSAYIEELDSADGNWV